MINDSVPWKEELLKTASRLERKKQQKRWTERSSFLVERDIMVGAFAVRRLRESYKISDNLAARSFAVRCHRQAGKMPDVWNRYEVWDLYDLTTSKEVHISLVDLCNQIIHSWIWTFSVDEADGLLDGILLCSDRKRRSCLYYIDVDLLIDLFRSVGREDIVSLRMQQGPTGERVYTEILGAPSPYE